MTQIKNRIGNILALGIDIVGKVHNDVNADPWIAPERYNRAKYDGTFKNEEFTRITLSVALMIFSSVLFNKILENRPSIKRLAKIIVPWISTPLWANALDPMGKAYVNLVIPIALMTMPMELFKAQDKNAIKTLLQGGYSHRLRWLISTLLYGVLVCLSTAGMAISISVVYPDDDDLNK